MGSRPSTFQQPDSKQIGEVGSDDYNITVKQIQPECMCTTCARNDKHVIASIYCKSCQDHLCFRCLQWHSKYRSEHVDDLIGQDEMRKLGVHGSPVMPTEKCLDHDDKMWNMFCQKDGIAGCLQYMDEKHRACKSVIPRSTQHINSGNSQTPYDTQIETANIQIPYDGQVGSKLRQLSLNNGQVDGQKREHYQSNDLHIGGKVRQHFADRQVDGRKRKSDNQTEYNSAGGESKQNLQRQYNDQADEPNKTNTQSIQAIISSSENEHVHRISGMDVEKQTRPEDDGQVSGTRNQHIGLYFTGSYRDVSLDNDSPCDLHEIWVLSDGRILILDTYNATLKLLDSNHNMINHIVIEDNLIDICMINDTEATLAIYGGYIQFASIKNDIMLERKIKLDQDFGYSWGVAHSGGELFISDMYINIHVYTLKGEKLRTIKICLIEEPKCRENWLTLSKDGRRIYITTSGYGIVCVERLSGEVIWKVNDTDDNWYCGVCVDMYNNVFVCRVLTSDVVQFSPSGKLTGVVISLKGLYAGPSSICIDEVRNRFIVGFAGLSIDDVVKIIDFKL